MKTTTTTTTTVQQQVNRTTTTTEQQQQQLPFPANLDPRSPMNRTLKLRQGPQSPQHSPGGTQAPGLLGYDRGAWWRERWGASTSGHYPIFLQMPGNQPSCLIEVDPAWGADDLKAKIQDLHGVAASEVRLMHGGRELRSEDVAKSLSSFGVKEFATVQCLFRLHGGGKAKSKGGKSFKKGKKTEQKTELVFKEEEQEYAQVTALLGSSRLRVRCADGVERLCTIRGKLQRRAWVAVGSIILVSFREFEQGKCDMIHRYSDDEARRLRAYDELPREMKLISDESNAGDGEGGDDGIVFDFDIDAEGDVDIDAI